MVLAVKAQRRAQAECTNKHRCVDHELQERREQATMYSLMTAQLTGGRVLFDSALAAVSPGAFVLVSGDLSQHKYSRGGSGWIKALSGVREATNTNGEYLETENSGCFKLEWAIPRQLVRFPIFRSLKESDLIVMRLCPQIYPKWLLKAPRVPQLV
jgi:hypothetical protein